MKITYTLFVVLLVSLFWVAFAIGDGTCDDENSEDQQECKNIENDSETTTTTADETTTTIINETTTTSPAAIRMVTKEELATQIGVEEGTDIWLSVLGEVYNVTTGKDYYQQGSSYGAFAGIDCSLCFVSGIFTKEEGEKETDQIPFEQLPSLMEWRNFYAGHATYKFVGYLLDDRFYDEHGKPTPKMLELRERVKSSMEAAAIKKAERDKKRAEMKQRREEEKKKKETQQIG